MSDTTTDNDAASSTAADTPAAPAAEAAPVSQAAATPTPAADGKRPSFDEALENMGLMTEEQIAAFESGDFSSLGIKPTAAPAAPATPASPESPAQQPTNRLQAALVAQTPEELAAAGADLGRISIKSLSPEDRARTVRALDLIRGGKAPSEAFAEVFGITAPAANTPAPEDAQPGAEPAAAAPTIADLESQLADLQRKYKEAKEAFDPSATDILEQMTDVKMDLREARRESAAAGQAWMTKQAESHARAMSEFKELISDPNLQFTKFCDFEIYLAETENDPILQQPDWPEKIGQRAKDKFFKGRAAKSAEPVIDESQPIPPAPRQSVRLPGSPVGPAFTAGALSMEVAQAEIGKLTDEQEKELLYELDRLTAPKRR